MIKGAIFDADGTMFDSMHMWDNIGEKYLISIGHTPKENLNEIFKNMSLYQAADYYKTEYGVTFSIDEIMAGVNNMIKDFYFFEAQFKPGVLEFLKILYDKGVRMCVATATDKPYIKAALERCKAAEFFSEIFTCTSVGCGKDEPVIYREALKYLGTERENTVVFEDALYAVKTAKNDGFKVAVVYDAYERNKEETKALSDFYINDYTNLKDFWKFASAI